jgi:hypothetical protein
LFSDNKVLVAQKGGIEVVVRAMNLHAAVAVVQEHGCVALQNISFNTGKLINNRRDQDMRIACILFYLPSPLFLFSENKILVAQKESI